MRERYDLVKLRGKLPIRVYLLAQQGYCGGYELETLRRKYKPNSVYRHRQECLWYVLN
jgi:hypothetical protein